jgi:hypothetical protein
LQKENASRNPRDQSSDPKRRKEGGHDLRDDDDVVGEAGGPVVRGAVPRGARARLRRPEKDRQFTDLEPARRCGAERS